MLHACMHSLYKKISENNTWNVCSTIAAEANVEEAKTTKAHASKSVECAIC